MLQENEKIPVRLLKLLKVRAAQHTMNRDEIKINKKDCVLNICSHNWDINDSNYKWGY